MALQLGEKLTVTVNSKLPNIKIRRPPLHDVVAARAGFLTGGYSTGLHSPSSRLISASRVLSCPEAVPLTHRKRSCLPQGATSKPEHLVSISDNTWFLMFVSDIFASGYGVPACPNCADSAKSSRRVLSSWQIQKLNVCPHGASTSPRPQK